MNKVGTIIMIKILNILSTTFYVFLFTRILNNSVRRMVVAKRKRVLFRPGRTLDNIQPSEGLKFATLTRLFLRRRCETQLFPRRSPDVCDKAFTGNFIIHNYSREKNFTTE